MDYLQHNNHKLTQLIKHCNTTESQLNDIKKSLHQYDIQSNDTYHQTIYTSIHTHSRNSSDLIKSSSQHMDQFQKNQAKLSSCRSAFISLNSTQILPFHQQKSTNIISSKLQNNVLKKEAVQNIPQQQINKRKQQGFKYRLIKRAENNSQKKVKPKANNESQPQIYCKQQSQSTERQTLKLMRQYSNQYLPRIKSTYLQTFSPKNASLSQQALAKRQLQQSVFKKPHDQKCKLYYKANIIKEYQQSKNKMEQKLQVYRLNILKKISFDNVKKYLYNEKKRKQAHSVALMQLGKRSQTYKSFMKE